MILFVYFLATVTAILNDDLYQKLKNYQNLTGIPNEEFNLLWQKQYDSGKYIFLAIINSNELLNHMNYSL